MRIVCLLAALALISCSRESSTVDVPQQCQPLVDIAWDYMSREDKAALSEASEDFCAVLVGKSPVHAQPDLQFSAPPNGSTRRYLGRGYQLTAVRNARFIGGVPVGVAGPVLRFDSNLGAGESLEISQLRIVGIPPTP